MKSGEILEFVELQLKFDKQVNINFAILFLLVMLNLILVGIALHK